jgi:hypothetical protein
MPTLETELRAVAICHDAINEAAKLYEVSVRHISYVDDDCLWVACFKWRDREIIIFRGCAVMLAAAVVATMLTVLETEASICKR